MAERAELHDDLGATASDGTLLVVTIACGRFWPHVVIALRFEPGPESGFVPGVVVIPKTQLLLIGAGTRLLAYDLKDPRRLWEDVADVGFLGWKRHGNVLVMSAELELAAWTLDGAKLWSTFVEPPWDYEVFDGKLHLDVMGKRSDFDLVDGPRSPGAGQQTIAD